MKPRFIAFSLALILVTFLAGYYLEKYCYRLPTNDEMSEYHSGHFSTKLIKLESRQLKRKDGSDCILFKGLHQLSGVEEIYFVEAGKRWVMPWQSYNWKNNPSSSENND